MPIGVYSRPNAYKMKRGTCLFCSKTFAYKFYKKTGRRKYCGLPCHIAHEREKRRKVPHDFALLYELYWARNMTTTEIGARFNTDHSTVKHRMIQLGIPRRKRGHSRLTTCIVSGCSEPIYRIIHANNGSPYGRRCLMHWVAHRKKLSAEYYHAIKEWKRTGLFNNGGQNDIATIIDGLVPQALPFEIRDEVCQELALDLLTRKLTYSRLRAAVPNYIKRFFKEYQNKFGDLSLDAPIGEGGFTLGETLIG